jgi:CRP-like cAMP-binding protein
MTETDDMKSLLRDSEFFAGFDEASLELVAPHARPELFQAGAYLLRDGASAETLYLLRHGTVAVELSAPPRGRLLIQTLHQGETVGWSWLVPPYHWNFDVRAVSLVRTLSVDARVLRELAERNHEFGYRLLQRLVPLMAGRINAARMQMLDLYAPMPNAPL